MGALLLGLGTFAAIEGPVNTFLRAQKLFPGPHLYVGAGIVVSWAVAASLVPQMQKGSDNARIAHMAINFSMIGLFAWQVRVLYLSIFTRSPLEALEVTTGPTEQPPVQCFWWPVLLLALAVALFGSSKEACAAFAGHLFFCPAAPLLHSV